LHSISYTDYWQCIRPHITTRAHTSKTRALTGSTVGVYVRLRSEQTKQVPIDSLNFVKWHSAYYSYDCVCFATKNGVLFIETARLYTVSTHV